LVQVYRVSVPTNCASILIGLRLRLGLSQQQLAARVGAAGKAVVYCQATGETNPLATLKLTPPDLVFLKAARAGSAGERP
jgi:hypothetical protein